MPERRGPSQPEKVTTSEAPEPAWMQAMDAATTKRAVRARTEPRQPLIVVTPDLEIDQSWRKANQGENYD